MPFEYGETNPRRRVTPDSDLPDRACRIWREEKAGMGLQVQVREYPRYNEKPNKQRIVQVLRMPAKRKRACKRSTCQRSKATEKTAFEVIKKFFRITH